MTVSPPDDFNLKLAVYFASSFASSFGKQKDLLDFIQVANAGLITAVERFDVDKNKGLLKDNFDLGDKYNSVEISIIPTTDNAANNLPNTIPVVDKDLIKKTKKHIKPNNTTKNAGIISMEAKIDASNVMYVHKGQAVRVGFEVKDGKKVRVAKVNGKREAID